MDAKVGVYWQFRMGSFCHGRVRLAIDGGNADLVRGGGDSFFFQFRMGYSYLFAFGSS